MGVLVAVPVAVRFAFVLVGMRVLMGMFMLMLMLMFVVAFHSDTSLRINGCGGLDPLSATYTQVGADSEGVHLC
jgi:hypothetical protein